MGVELHALQSHPVCGLSLLKRLSHGHGKLSQAQGLARSWLRRNPMRARASCLSRCSCPPPLHPPVSARPCIIGSQSSM